MDKKKDSGSSKRNTVSKNVDHGKRWSDWHSVQVQFRDTGGVYTTTITVNKFDNNQVEAEVISTQKRNYPDVKLLETPFYANRLAYIDSNIKDFNFTFINSVDEDKYPTFLNETDLLIQSTHEFMSVKTKSDIEYRFGMGEIPGITLNDDKGSIILKLIVNL